jgi:RHS repeat-associated protein
MYTAYGEPRIMNHLGNLEAFSVRRNRYMFTGREWDPAISLYHFRARWYDATAGRFTTRDPLGYVDGINKYRLGISLSNSDPTGMLTQKLKRKSLDFGNVNSIGYLARGMCGAHEFVTEWILEDGETDGWIFQKVTATFDVNNCDNTREGERTPVVPFIDKEVARRIKNEIVCPNSSYYEVWEVRGGKILGGWDSKKSKAVAFGGGHDSLDHFSHWGFTETTYGSFSKHGEAVFVPASAFNEVRTFLEKMKSGTFGVINAGNLRSACSDDAMDAMWMTIKAVNGVSAVTTKTVERSWNCCGYCCINENLDALFEEAGTVGGIVVLHFQAYDDLVKYYRCMKKQNLLNKTGVFSTTINGNEVDND